MKSEYLYTLRMYTSLLIAVGDFLKLKDLILDFRLLTAFDEEQHLSNALSENHKAFTLHGQAINKDLAL